MRFTTTDNYADGLLNITTKKDKMVVTHIQKLDPLLEACQDLRKLDSRLAKKPAFRLIGKIPPLALRFHPELAKDPKAALKFLKSEEGKIFKTTNEAL